jgi:hypothetical protein
VASLAYGLGTSACGKLGLWTSACGLLGLQPYISVGQALVETGIGTDFKIAKHSPTMSMVTALALLGGVCGVASRWDPSRGDADW